MAKKNAKGKKTLNDIAVSFGVTWDKLTDDLVEWGYMKKSKDWKKSYASLFEWSDEKDDYVLLDGAEQMIKDDKWASAYTESNEEEKSEETETEEAVVEDEPEVEESDDDKSDDDVDSEESTEEDESGEIDVGDNPFDESVGEESEEK